VDELIPGKPVERLFPFVLRARLLVVGADNAHRRRSSLQFVLITKDLSPKSREKLLADFSPVPVIERYSSADLDTYFGIKGAKVVGFKKSSLARSIYGELKKNLPQPPPGS